IKVVLALQHREIPPTINCEKPNPRFRFAESPFYPITTLQPWPQRLGARVAGLSSFGFGGTNVHIVLSEPDPQIMRSHSVVHPPLPAPSFNRKRYWPGGHQAPELLPTHGTANGH